MLIEIDIEILYRSCPATVSFVKILSDTFIGYLKVRMSFHPYCPHFLPDLVRCGAQDLQNLFT